jgi:hypothetical protein
VFEKRPFYKLVDSLAMRVPARSARIYTLDLLPERNDLTQHLTKESYVSLSQLEIEKRLTSLGQNGQKKPRKDLSLFLS